MLINVNTADKEELKQIPGVGERVARLLIQFREVYGVIKKEALNLALRIKLPAEALDMIDFSVPGQDDPFDTDLSCLPAVPKTDSWEPLVSFAHQITARQSRSQAGESLAMSASHFAEQKSSAMLAGGSSMHESQESRSCRTDSRPVMRPMLNQLITALENQTLKSRKRTELHQGQGHRDIPDHHREVWGLVDPNLPIKAYRSSSRSRSPSSRRHSRKHSPKGTHRSHSKRSSSVSRSRSHSSSVSRSISVERHSRKSEKKVTKKKKYNFLTSTSRSMLYCCFTSMVNI